jgi:AbrB family looped-hinge helix DNA binding protein
MITTTVTQKGQATIPAYIRKKLGIRVGEKVVFEERGREVVLRPLPDLSSLRGSLKTDKKYDEDKIVKSVGEMLVKRNGKNS